MVLIWLMLSLGLILTEMLLGELTALMLCIGALSAAGAAFVGLGWLYQGLIFGLVSLGAVAFLRPLLRDRLQPAHSALSTDGFVGCRASVLEALPEGRCRVKIHGEIWNADCYEALEPGESVIVTAIRDNSLEVVPWRALESEPLPARPAQLEGESK